MRDALTEAAAARAVAITRQGGEPTPIAEVVDEKAMVNACVALLASGGSTNHTLHLVAIARAAGIQLTWQDLSDLSAAVPLLCRIYPNGPADVNHFHAAGGHRFLVHTLLRAGLLHEDVTTVMGRGLSTYTREPVLRGGTLTWEEGPKQSLDLDVLRPADAPFAPDGGLKVLSGPLGTSVVKTSAVRPEHRVVTAPALVFDGQADFLAAFSEGRLDGRDFVAVLRYQGPAANGMPELHKLTPALGVLQDRGHRVAIVTDGRMSGASGKVPAAIHVTPEAALGGPLARVRDGDLITVDADGGVLDVITTDVLQEREPTGRAPTGEEFVGHRPGAVRGVPRHRRPGRPGRQHLPAIPATRNRRRWPLSSPSERPGSLLDIVPVLPVVVLERREDAVPVARALVAGGLPAIELTLRTPAALDAIRAISDEVPEILVGAGTVVTPGQAKEALDAGARFLVSPGSTPDAAVGHGRHRAAVPPGTSTVSEVLAALELGLTELKFFPAEASGGTAYLRAIAGTGARRALLPDRRHHAGLRPGLPRPAQRGLRRGLVAGPAGRRTPGRLGRDHGAGGEGGRARDRFVTPAPGLQPSLLVGGPPDSPEQSTLTTCR